MGLALIDTNILIDHMNGVPAIRKIKTSDAVILATAHVTGRMLVSRDADDFVGVAKVTVRLPYRYSNGTVSDVAAAP